MRLQHPALAAVVTIALLVSAAGGAFAQQTYPVVATGRTNGTTPDLIGISLGHAFSGSNW